jgi:phosphoglycerate dehydrogenase-like enzyme
MLTRMVRVALLDDYQGVALTLADWKRLPQGSVVESFLDHLTDEDALATRLCDFDVVVATRERTPFPRTLLARLPQLKLLVTKGPRNAVIDVAAATEHGVVVCGTRSTAPPTAELTWALILGLVRNVAREDRAIRDGGWQHTLGRTLSGLTLGCLGLGNLGARVAKTGSSFGMDVIAWSQNLTQERCKQVGARLVSREQLFAEADVLTVHLQLSERTRGLVGRRELALMKRDAYLVNTSRGPIVDEAALVEALRERRIAGAGLDVYDTEPLPEDHPLRSLDNTLLTPHLGYVTREEYELYYQDALEDILAFLESKPIRVISG